MTSSDYLIGTGYFHKPEQYAQAKAFYRLWYTNTFRYAKPRRVLVLANGGCHIPGAPGQWIHVNGNLGHAHELSSGKKPYTMCGWSAAFVALAMIAYTDECDFVFKEQDTLAFGPWVERMWEEIGSKSMVFGNNQYACAQSLVLIKRAFIPEFVQLYMAEGSEQLKSNECEIKFARMEAARPDLFGRFSFGVDRVRPIPYDASVWYAQHFTKEELTEMKGRGLI